MLLLVLVIVPVLALAAYSFNHWMRAEAHASRTAWRQAQVRLAAESGIELVRAILADPQNLEPEGIDLVDNPGALADVPVSGEDDDLAVLVSIVAPADENTVRNGLVNESARIPLHNANLSLTREALMGLPEMTEPLADAILDWLDPDDEPRESGAEASYYAGLDPSYEPANGPPQTLGELLLVKGVTPELLYGEDRNLNGILDPSEDDGDETWPSDDADGSLDPGWYPYLTVHSRAANTNSQGEPKIDLAAGASSRRGQSDASSSSAGPAPSGTSGTEGDAGQSEATARLSQLFGPEFASFLAEYQKQNGAPKSVSQLIDATVTQRRTDERGRSVSQTLRSPWTAANVGEYLETALDELTVSAGTSIAGMVDVNAAPEPVLRCLPGVTEELAARIADAARSRTGDDRTPAWLLLEGIVSLEEFQRIEPYVTTQNRVFRVEAVGFLAGGGPVARIQAVLDASGSAPRVVWRQEPQND